MRHIRKLPLGKALAFLSLAVALLVPITLSAQTFSGKCVGVSDGDTIKVLREGKETKIRLEGIDCPETGAPFSAKAKKFTSSLVFGKTVTVRVKETDRYGRLVARVLADGQDVSIALVQAGLAWHYTMYSSDPALAQADKTARAAQIGIWSLRNPIPPWEVKAERARATREPSVTSTEETGIVYHGKP